MKLMFSTALFSGSSPKKRPAMAASKGGPQPGLTLVKFFMVNVGGYQTYPKIVYRCLLVGGLEHEFYFSTYIGNVMILTSFYIFQRAIGIPPSSLVCNPQKRFRTILKVFIG